MGVIGSIPVVGRIPLGIAKTQQGVKQIKGGKVTTIRKPSEMSLLEKGITAAGLTSIQLGEIYKRQQEQKGKSRR